MNDNSAAKKLLLDTDSTASAVYMAASQRIDPPHLQLWEPESVWLELTEWLNAELPQINKDKLQAAITYHADPEVFYYDAALFENTCLALNGEAVVLSAPQMVIPAHIAWALEETDTWRPVDIDRRDFDYGPTKYTALIMSTHGMVLAPKALEFAQAELDKMSRMSKVDIQTLKDSANIVYMAATSALGGPENYPFKDDAANVQAALMVTVDLHVTEMKKRCSDELQLLPSDKTAEYL